MPVPIDFDRHLYDDFRVIGRWRTSTNLSLLNTLASLLVAPLLLSCTCKTTHSSGGTSSTTCEPADLAVAATCAANGNNVKGHIVFGNGVTIVPGADVIIQWSTDSFVTSTSSGATVNNGQGFVAVPFSFCGPLNQPFQLRAFQSVDHTANYQVGQPTGRYDGTDNGNGTYTTIKLVQGIKSEWHLEQGIELVLDGGGPQ